MGWYAAVHYSPEGDSYFRIGLDADRVNDEPAIANLWSPEEFEVQEELVIELFGGNLVIRKGNEDSFQGQDLVPELTDASWAGCCSHGAYQKANGSCRGWSRQPGLHYRGVASSLGLA